MKHSRTCSLCEGRRKLWLGGSDYVECPDCDATGKFEYHEERVRKTERVIFIPGLPAVRTLTNRIIKATA